MERVIEQKSEICKRGGNIAGYDELMSKLIWWSCRGEMISDALGRFTPYFF